MIIIFPANTVVLSILGKQTFTRDDTFRLSSFCLCEPVTEGTLIFNNLTKELIIVESPLSSLSTEEYTALIERWFFVPDSFDELKTADELTDILRISMQKSDGKAFTIFTTTECNARCFYCFEKGISPLPMTSATALQVAQYIVDHCKKKDSVSIRWFGGEPLLNTAAIDLICEYLSSNSDLNFVSSLVTNGYLLNNELIDHAIKNWNLKKVQISLDGTESVYNKVKAYVYSDCNAYHTVINNLVSLSTYDVQTIIRLNIDEYNLQNMYSLVHDLSISLNRKEYICISAVPLFEKAGATKRVRSEEQRSHLLKEIVKIRQYAMSEGFSQRIHLKRIPVSNTCAADNKNAVIIMPNGDLLRCEHVIEKKANGNVYSNEDLSCGLWTQYYPPLPICHTCPLYPTCYRLMGCVEIEDCTPSIKEWRISEMRECMLAEYKKYNQ